MSAEERIIKASEYGILPGKETGRELNAALKALRAVEGRKILQFEEGVYYIDVDSCPEEKLYITNTISEGEYKPGEKKYVHRVALDVKDTSDLTLRGENAVFVTRGKVTACVILNSENIVIDGIEIRAENPDEHEFTVERVYEGSADFSLDGESRYAEENGSFYFTGRDYRTPFTFNAEKWRYFGKISARDENRIERSAHPFKNAEKITCISPYRFRVEYGVMPELTPGERYCLYDLRRTDVGFFMEKSRNITLTGVKLRHNISLAVVAQNTENITLSHVDFSTGDSGEKRFASYADFMQFCMCRGKISVTDSRFVGAGDDVLNVHGTHLIITSVEGSRVKLRFMHPESYGYLPFNEGDEIEFVNPETLLPSGSAIVKSAELTDEYSVVLCLDSAEGAAEGFAVENVSLCPDLYFARNYTSRIVTRGLLVTTRGKVVIEENDFDSLIMPAILFSDDAKTWYESGRCRDVTVRRNRFGKTDTCYIQCFPENLPNRNAVHGSFLIEENVFEGTNGVEFERCESLVFRNNTFPGSADEFVRCRDVGKIIIDV